MVWLTEAKEIVALIMPWLTGGGIVYVINWLKDYFNVSDEPWLFGFGKRVWLAVGVSFGAAVLSHFAEGLFDPENLTPENLAETIAIVVATAQAFYFKHVREPGGDN